MSLFNVSLFDFRLTILRCLSFRQACLSPIFCLYYVLIVDRIRCDKIIQTYILEVNTNIATAENITDFGDNNGTCVILTSSTKNFWNLQFTIDEHLQIYSSEFEVRLHQEKNSCKMFDVIFLQSESNSCYKFFRTCTLLGFFEGSSEGSDRPYCSYSCLCRSSVKRCSTLSISLVESKQALNVSLCNITFFKKH